ncbi:collagen alpha-1(I) chain-like [Mustela nigripes]|uniref:collagen alpha-1(I) chain-like n=1 Tax=Mustela nigripes TaxID=77151 RepID=UPI00281515D6|nr:collagen alpha-1(I) chain-like [Mustela nigripes]
MQVRVLTGAVDHDGTFRTRSLRDDWLQMRGSRRTTQPGLRRAVLGGPSVWPLQLCHQHIPVGPAMVSPPVGPAMVSPSELPTGTTETSGFSANQSAALGTWVFSTTLLSVPEPSSLKGPELTNPSVSLCVKKQGSNRAATEKIMSGTCQDSPRRRRPRRGADGKVGPRGLALTPTVHLTNAGSGKGVSSEDGCPWGVGQHRKRFPFWETSAPGGVPVLATRHTAPGAEGCAGRDHLLPGAMLGPKKRLWPGDSSGQSRVAVAAEDSQREAVTGGREAHLVLERSCARSRGHHAVLRAAAQQTLPPPAAAEPHGPRMKEKRRTGPQPDRNRTRIPDRNRTRIPDRNQTRSRTRNPDPLPDRNRPATRTRHPGLQPGPASRTCIPDHHNRTRIPDRIPDPHAGPQEPALSAQPPAAGGPDAAGPTSDPPGPRQQDGRAQSPTKGAERPPSRACRPQRGPRAGGGERAAGAPRAGGGGGAGPQEPSRASHTRRHRRRGRTRTRRPAFAENFPRPTRPLRPERSKAHGGFRTRPAETVGSRNWPLSRPGRARRARTPTAAHSVAPGPPRAARPSPQTAALPPRRQPGADGSLVAVRVPREPGQLRALGADAGQTGPTSVPRFAERTGRDGTGAGRGGRTPSHSRPPPRAVLGDFVTARTAGQHVRDGVPASRPPRTSPRPPDLVRGRAFPAEHAPLPRASKSSRVSAPAPGSAAWRCVRVAGPRRSGLPVPAHSLAAGRAFRPRSRDLGPGGPRPRPHRRASRTPRPAGAVERGGGRERGDHVLLLGSETPGRSPQGRGTPRAAEPRASRRRRDPTGRRGARRRWRRRPVGRSAPARRAAGRRRRRLRRGRASVRTGAWSPRDGRWPVPLRERLAERPVGAADRVPDQQRRRPRNRPRGGPGHVRPQPGQRPRPALRKPRHSELLCGPRSCGRWTAAWAGGAPSLSDPRRPAGLCSADTDARGRAETAAADGPDALMNRLSEARRRSSGGSVRTAGGYQDPWLGLSV